jgi:hypothetical protein
MKTVEETLTRQYGPLLSITQLATLLDRSRTACASRFDLRESGSAKSTQPAYDSDAAFTFVRLKLPMYLESGKSTSGFRTHIRKVDSRIECDLVC